MSDRNGKVRLGDDCFRNDGRLMRHAEVLALLDERLTGVVGTERLPLDRAVGRFLAEHVVAARDVPLHDNAAVDGYAFAHADYARRNTLALRGRVAAGDPAPPTLGAGGAVQIFTGATIPEGADTVAMQEDCALSDDGSTVTIPAGLRPGANLRRAGEDMKAGATALETGRRLNPADIAALASFGLDSVSVRRTLRVAIASTGNELVEPGDGAGALALGQVFDSNRAMLKALAATLPLELTDLGILADDAGAIAATLGDAACRHDIIVTTGGASRGEEDHLAATLERIGRRHLWQIAVKPGRPLIFGQIPGNGRDCAVFGLPGNPAAVFVSFLLYLRPALARMGGGALAPVLRLPLPAAFEISRRKTGRREFLRGWLNSDAAGVLVVEKYPQDGSGLITGLRRATGLIELAEEVGHVARGDRVTFIPLSSLGLDV